MAKTPTPPGPKLDETEPSVQTRRSKEGGRRGNPLQLLFFPVTTHALSIYTYSRLIVYSGIKGFTENEGKLQGDKGEEGDKEEQLFVF